MPPAYLSVPFPLHLACKARNALSRRKGMHSRQAVVKPTTFRWTDQDLRGHVPSTHANLARERRVELDGGKHLRGSGQAERYRGNLSCRKSSPLVRVKCPPPERGGSPFGCERFWQILRGPLAHRRPTDRPIGGGAQAWALCPDCFGAGPKGVPMIPTPAWVNPRGFSVSGSPHCRRRRRRGSAPLSIF